MGSTYWKIKSLKLVNMLRLGIKLIRPTAKPPAKMTEGSAGFDLYSAEEVVVPPCHCYSDGSAEVGRALIPTGIIIELPAGTVGRVGARSGLSVKSNIETGAGWIDSDYRGEVMVELKNFSSQPFNIGVGDRIAQLVILTVTDIEVEILSELGETSRGSGGFGSTGL